MAVRRFTRTSGDNIDFGPVNLTGAFTIVLVVKRMSNGVWHSLIEGLTSANAVAWAVEIDNVGDVSMESNGVAVIAGSVLAADGHVVIVVSKPAGTTGISLDLYKGSWAARATIGTGTPNPPSQAGGSIKFGRYGIVSGDDADVELTAAAIWNGTQLTQTQAQALIPGSASAWDGNAAGAPTEHWEFNQAAVTTSITGRKGVSSQTARSGTTVVTGDDPSTGIYAFTSGTPTGSAVTTAGAASTATGRRVGQRAPVSSAGAASTATGRRVARGAATSTAGAASTATGGQPVITHSGSATSTAGATSTATGRRVSRSAPASTAGAASTVTTRRVSQSSHEEVSALPPFTITVAGVLTAAAAASTASGTAAGVETHSGSASTSVGAASAASGRRKALRSALSSGGAASAASGRRVSRGTPLTTAAAASTSTARRISRGSCVTTAGASSSASGTSNGVPTRNGSASTTAGAASTATGRRVSRGACISANAAASTVGWRRVSRGGCMTTAGAVSVAAGKLPGDAVVFAPIDGGGRVASPSSGYVISQQGVSIGG